MKAPEYLEYLDKEMTIMGVLSAVSIAAPAAILNFVMSGTNDIRAEVWREGKGFIVTASCFCVLAALFFYKQRSKLAWFYGQICLAETGEADTSPSTRLREWLREADSWQTWWPYSWGFTSLIAAFCQYVIALLLYIASESGFAFLRSLKMKITLLCLVLLLVGVFAAAQRYVLTRYKFADQPLRSWWSDVRKFRSKFPDDGVYTRLKPSGIAGIGVFAIRDIPEGTYIFEPDDDDLVSVNASYLDTVSGPLRQLYEDFCVLQGDTYQCPKSLNRLTPSWFLNASAKPNVAADLSLKFYALREIKAGEELTADYSTYCDEPRSSSVPPAM